MSRNKQIYNTHIKTPIQYNPVHHIYLQKNKLFPDTTLHTTYNAVQNATLHTIQHSTQYNTAHITTTLHTIPHCTQYTLYTIQYCTQQYYTTFNNATLSTAFCSVQRFAPKYCSKYTTCDSLHQKERRKKKKEDKYIMAHTDKTYTHQHRTHLRHTVEYYNKA